MLRDESWPRRGMRRPIGLGIATRLIDCWAEGKTCGVVLQSLWDERGGNQDNNPMIIGFVERILPHFAIGASAASVPSVMPARTVPI